MTKQIVALFAVVCLFAGIRVANAQERPPVYAPLFQTASNTNFGVVPPANTFDPFKGPLNSEIRRLPPVDSVVNQRPQADATNKPEAVDGTWREADGQIIINLNGQQLKLQKTGGVQGSSSSNTAAAGGEVRGRLLHKGRPVTNCTVALLPLKKTWNGYTVDGSAQPPIMQTDEDGVYYFPDVPPGPYKLSWLPEGERQWIRRVEFRPDVRVKSGDLAYAKEIRASLRTVN